MTSFASLMTANSEASAPGYRLADLAAPLMDAVEFGLIVCRSDGCVVHANRAALREMGQDRPLRQDGNLLTCLGPERELLAGALRDAARGIRRLFTVGRNGAGLMVVTQPVQQDGARDAVLVVLGRRSLCSPLGLELLASRHGLTLAEKDVLLSLIDTQAVRDIARERGVQLCTIRTQIQSIRGKVGVRNVEELMLRVAQVPVVATSAG